MIGWEAEMQKVDEECERHVLLPKINPAVGGSEGSRTCSGTQGSRAHHKEGAAAAAVLMERVE